MLTFIPVSYTHLDVYKRQVLLAMSSKKLTCVTADVRCSESIAMSFANAKQFISIRLFLLPSSLGSLLITLTELNVVHNNIPCCIQRI